MSSDDAFRAWIQTLPSCISGNFSEYVHGEGRCLAAHVRRAATSGTAFKPLYASIPLTKAEHDVQHQKGEVACLQAFLGGRWTVGEAKAWFDERVVEYREEWLRITVT